RASRRLCAAVRIHETKLDDAPAAGDAYTAAARLDPRRIDSQEAVSRCAARAGRWAEAASAALLAIIARERPEGTIIRDLEAAAEAAAAYGELAGAVEAAIAEHQSELRTTLARALELLVARWWAETGAIDKAA